MKSLYALLVLLVTLSFPAYADKDQTASIAKLVKLEGTTTVTQDANEPNAATEGMPLYMNDVVETAEGSKALILFNDDTYITLAEETRLKIDEYIFDPEQKEEAKGTFSFLSGAFLWTSGTLPSENVEINTPQGSIGIRGTVVWGGTLNDKYGVYVQEGEIVYAGKWGERTLKTNDGIFVSENEILRDVAQWGQPMIDLAVETIAFKDQDAVMKSLEELKSFNKDQP